MTNSKRRGNLELLCTSNKNFAVLTVLCENYKNLSRQGQDKPIRQYIKVQNRGHQQPSSTWTLVQ